ncbi:type VI secretion system TssO [Aquimarina algiphila]|uniref:type VI secretion system TssO n=1 Tax=Aquimarina algiphila TaxID=2047982 RepID=UPI00232E3D2B|nr:type VI secretion system TssO [Aquimarina algiphila]
MKTEDLSEVFWRKIKYVLLFTLSIVLLYILQTKFILKIPAMDNTELLEAIDGYETIIERQAEYAVQVKNIHEEITAMEFDIHQVQKQDEINKKIFSIRSVYKENKMNSKYFFGIQSANILQIYFDTREEHSSLIKNKKIILDNLKECKANI